MVISIDPHEWLESQDPGAVELGALDAGRMLLEAHQHNIFIALAAEPELRLEVVLAWLLRESEAAGCEHIRKRVQQIGEFVDAAESV